MDIQVRFVDHHPDEIRMGQVLFYRPDPRADSISVTANVNRSTTLKAVARAYAIPEENLVAMANHANRLPNKYPWCAKFYDESLALFVIPRVQGEPETRRMTRKLLDDTIGERIQTLELSHFQFIQGKQLWPEVRIVLEEIRDRPQDQCPNEIIVDIDQRHRHHYVDVHGSVFGNTKSEPLIQAQQESPAHESSPHAFLRFLYDVTLNDDLAHNRKPGDRRALLPQTPPPQELRNLFDKQRKQGYSDEELRWALYFALCEHVCRNWVNNRIKDAVRYRAGQMVVDPMLIQTFRSLIAELWDRYWHGQLRAGLPGDIPVFLKKYPD